MPIFEYICNKCKKTKDKLVSLSDADGDKTFNCECDEGGTLIRSTKPSSAALRFKGQWYSTTRSY